MRVLLVEDEERLAAVVKVGLEAEGLAVDVEHEGQSGLWRATTGSYDVIILDIMLPGLNGYQICARLRQNEVWTPVLMLTAKDGHLDEAEALDTGADDFLRKPFAFEVLLARLRALSRRGAPERPLIIRRGSLSFDPAAAKVDRGGVNVSLTRREFDVLEVLVRANGDPVSSSEILDRVWGFDADPTSNVVPVVIRYLRRKLDEPFEVETIETVRGFGYRLISDQPSDQG